MSRAEMDAREAAMEAKYAHQDIQFEQREDGPPGAGYTWMTSAQLERAAGRLTEPKRTRATNAKYEAGQSDPAMDGFQVARAYLRNYSGEQRAQKIISQAAALLEAHPWPEGARESLNRADQAIAYLQRSDDCTLGQDSEAAHMLAAGYVLLRERGNRFVDRPIPDLTKLKMHPSIQLASGRYFDFTDPAATPLQIDDIAAGLSRICRYTGQLAIDEDDIYSVGQHSVLAAENTAGDPYEALLHDRIEAVMNDMASPLKQLLPDYKAIEERCEDITADYYGVPHPMTAECKAIDIRMLATEKRDLMAKDNDGDFWTLIQDVEPLPFTIKPWKPSETRHRFLHLYYYLTEGVTPQPGERYARPHANAPQWWIDVLAAEWGVDPRAEAA